MNRVLAIISHSRFLLGLMGVLVGLMGLVLAYTWNIDRSQDESVCSNFRTLESLITQTPTLDASSYMAFGFSAEQAGRLVDATARQRLSQLALLGDPPEGCP